MQTTSKIWNLMRVRELLGRVPRQFWQIALLLLASRLVLTVIGVVSRSIIPTLVLPPGSPYTSNIFLDVWGEWDTKGYIDIATKGYTYPMAYAWFPLFPLLMRVVNFVVHNALVAGLLVSNASLVVACIYLYKLVRLDADDATALRSIKYMILWPTAFVLSSVFTESTFLALSIAAFYYARKERWIIVGVIGFFASLTRNLGVFMLIPLLYMYLQQRRFTLKEVKPGLLALLLIPAGYGCWILFNYVSTGDPFAYAHAISLWGKGFFSIWSVLSVGFESNVVHVVWASFAMAGLLLLIVFLRKIPVPYWILGVYSILIPLSTGLWSMPRYTLVIFPFFILFAQLGESPAVDTTLTIALALLQGACMALWPYVVMS